MTLAWTAPAVTGGAPVIGYDLYLGTTLDPSASAPIARVTGTVVTVVGLANGTRYYFRVAAVSRIGPGPASDEAPAVPVTAPGAPTGLTATAADGRVTLAWTAPAATAARGSAATSSTRGPAPAARAALWSAASQSPLPATPYPA